MQNGVNAPCTIAMSTFVRGILGKIFLSEGKNGNRRIAYVNLSIGRSFG